MSLLFTQEEKMRKMRRRFKIRQKKSIWREATVRCSVSEIEPALNSYKDLKNRAQKRKAGGLEKSNEIYNPGLLF